MYQLPIFVRSKYEGYIGTIIYLYFRSLRLSIGLGHIQNFIIFIEKNTILYQCRILRIRSYTIYIPTPNLQEVGSSEPIFKELKKKKKKIKSKNF